MIDHDRLFKELITTFFLEFIELFLPAVADYLDAGSITALDKEVFTDVTSGERHEADIVMQARFKDGSEDAFFLVHVENQSYIQENFGRRMFQYFARLHEKYSYPVYPIVIFSYDSPLRPEPDTYQVAFPDRTVLEFRYFVIQLNQLNWQNYLARPNPVASALMAKMRIAPADRPRVKLECLRMLLGLELNPARTQVVKGFVDSYIDLNEIEQQAFQAEVEKILPTEKEEVMIVLNEWERKGFAKGKREGEADLVIRLLRRRVGGISAEQQERIISLPLEQIEELGESLLDFTQLADLEKWLADNKPKRTE